MMKLYKKVLASAAASVLVAFSGCSQNNSEPPSDDVPISASESTVKSQETKTETTKDPLESDYMPYGNEGVVTVTATSVKLISQTEGDEENTTTAVEEETTVEETEKSSEKPVEDTTVAVKEEKSKNETAKKEQNDKKQTDNDVQLTVNVPNGWSDGTNDFSQIDGIIKNSGEASVDGWTAEITASSGVSVEQFWNCEITVSGGKLTIKPVEHNKTIAPGGEGTFGFILKNPGKIDGDKAVLSCTLGSFAANSGCSSGENNTSGGSSTPRVPAKDVPAPTTDDWLSVKGNKIVDSSGKEVWLTGVNWFGYNTGTNTFDGLWSCDLNSSLASIADHGFNLLRVPISAELINNWSDGSYPTANFNQATNSYLVGMNSLEIFDYAVDQCRANGLKIMIDIHSAKTDSMGHMKNMWYEGNVTEQDYLDALSWMADRYKNDDTIIAYDLKNEPHGKANENPRAKWDSSKDSDNWKYVAEKAADAVLSENPNVLVMVEGIEIYPKDIKKNGNFASTNPGDYYSTWWGGNLRGVKDNPIDLGKYQNKLVYSPHDYGPAVYQQEWFKGDYTYESLKKDAWNDNWLYIHDNNTAPLLIGEWGGFMTQPNLKWMTYLRQLIKEKKLNHTFWCFNANSGDTGGLVKDDFTTWDNEKYEFVKEVLWQKNGKFVGLDHEIPLGKNGTVLE